MSVGFVSPAGNSGKNKGKKKRRGNAGNADTIAAFRFKPGQSGNPSGRPRRTALDDALKQMLEEEFQEVMTASVGMTVAQVLARGILKHAMKGNARAMQLAAERTGGKPRQQIDLNVSATQDLAERMDRSWSRAKEEK